VQHGLSAEKIDGLLRKWFRKLPHPCTAKDGQGVYRYQISILPVEFSLTHGWTVCGHRPAQSGAVVLPIEVHGQGASALRFGEAHVQALLSVRVLFSFQLRGYTKSGNANPTGSTAGSRSSPIYRGDDNLRPARPPSARSHPAHTQQTPL